MDDLNDSDDEDSGGILIFLPGEKIIKEFPSVSEECTSEKYSEDQGVPS